MMVDYREEAIGQLIKGKEGKLAKKKWQNLEKKRKETKQQYKKLKKKLSKTVKSKRIMKANKATVTIKERQAPSILGDPNRFFKDKEEDAEMQYFFR